MTTPTGDADIGLIGLGVMGQNLVLNMADHGYTVAVYNRTTSKMTEFVSEADGGPHEGVGGKVVGEAELADFTARLKRPRKVVILVKAGGATDATIEALADHLEDGDVIIDGGNAHWTDTDRREKDLTARGLRFVGSGVSGGELGARFGPSLMPGGPAEAWETLRPIWEAISAKVDPKTGKPYETNEPGNPVNVPGAEPCTAHIGPAGSGHFVKMVHNGIEYADMQLIAEAYDLLRRVAGLAPKEIAEVFREWNTGELDSYLIEITADILAQDDPRGTGPFVDVVLDAAGNKGTGKWTSVAALDMGVASPTIADAVFARYISAIKEERVRAESVLPGPDASASRELLGSRDNAIRAVQSALYAAKIVAYAQGLAHIAHAGEEAGWGLDLGKIASIWRGGCIIRARLLARITEAFERDASLPNLLLDQSFAKAVTDHAPAWRSVVAAATHAGVPVPCMGSALSWYDAYRTGRLPASLIQAQRDYFGAHTYERTDEARGKFFHVDWPEPDRPELNAD
ncbi:MAG: NADP-dependent phosphogluconate dehydrogenase [Planctomycetota bacterium]